MKRSKSLITLFTAALSAFLVVILASGCNESPVDPEGTSLSDKEILLKLVDEDEVVESLEPNFSEDEAASFLNKAQTEIYPFRVDHKMRPVNRDFNVEIYEDSAFGTLTVTFEGVLLIQAAYDSSSAEPDTVIEKPFTSIITRNIAFKKFEALGDSIRSRGGKQGNGRSGGGNGQGNNDPQGPPPEGNSNGGGNLGNGQGPEHGGGNGDPLNLEELGWDAKGWRIVAISLPEGGTGSENINITLLTLYLPDGEILTIDSPTDYFLERIPHFGNDFPTFEPAQEVKIEVTLYSAYADSDHVKLIYGAEKHGFHRTHKLLNFVSSTPSGSGYSKVYEQTYEVNENRGFFHAVVEAVPYQTINDDAAPVEVSIWGVPYIVK